MMSAAASSSPATVCSISPQFATPEAGPARVTAAASRSSSPMPSSSATEREPISCAVHSDLANERRHLSRERVRLVQSARAPCRAPLCCERAEPAGIGSCCRPRAPGRAAGRERARSRSPRATESAARTSRTEPLQRVRRSRLALGDERIRRLERSIPAPEHEVEPDRIAADEADARGVAVSLAESESPRCRARPSAGSRPRTTRRRRGC